jgi:tetratricopeptide (TPR) repeat protein
MSRKSLVPLVLCAFLALAFVFSLDAFAIQKNPQTPGRDQSTHLGRGLASFEQGFYEFLPKGRPAEAEAAFAAAVRELGLALQDDPQDKQALRTLARIETLRLNHLAAAEHYRRLTQIDPYDIDSYALGALSLAEAGRFAESRVELEKAKAHTADEQALVLLDGYLAKLAEAEKKAGAGR